jgi:hypothetical protein
MSYESRTVKLGKTFVGRQRMVHCARLYPKKNCELDPLYKCYSIGEPTFCQKESNKGLSPKGIIRGQILTGHNSSSGRASLDSFWQNVGSPME